MERVNQEQNFTVVETKVLRLFSQYYSEREIAEKLNLDLETVNDIKLKSLQKLNLKNFIELRRLLKTKPDYLDEKEIN